MIYRAAYIIFLLACYVALFFPSLSYSYTTCEYNTKFIDQWDISTTYNSYEYLGTYTSKVDAILAMTSGGQYASNSGMCFTLSAKADSSVKMSFCYGWADNDGNGQFQDQYDDIGPRVYTVWSTTGDACAFEPDSDGDNIPDIFDLYPNEASSYNAAVTGIITDSNGNVVGGEITDSNGNKYTFGEIPTDWEGYTISSVSESDANWMTGEDLADGLASTGIDPNITSSGQTGYEFDGSSIVPGSTSWAGMEDEAAETIVSTVPNTTEANTTTGSDSDADSTHLKNIVNNTDAINKNLENVQKYIGITNDYLAKLNAKASTSNTSSGSSTTSVNVDVDIDEQAIGQAVADALTDPTQTYDSSATSNMDAYSIDSVEQETISSKYGDRFSLFLTTIQGSDLFTVPFEIFSDIPTSTETTVTETIGSWGGESDASISFDISIYDPILTVIGNVFFVIGLYAAFKILVVKSAA